MHNTNGSESVCDGDLGTLVYSEIRLDSWPQRFNETIALPDTFKLRLAHESLDLLDDNYKPLVQFPYQTIVSWGFTPYIFRFSIQNPAKDKPLHANALDSICLRTEQAPIIDKMIMKTVLKLMADMKSMSTVSKSELDVFKGSLLVTEPTSDTNNSFDGELREDWFISVTQFCVTRCFLAKQAMELVQFIAPKAPFESMDLAEMLYTRVLNQEAFQLVVNVFQEPAERENLAHRLKIKGFVVNTQLIE